MFEYLHKYPDEQEPGIITSLGEDLRIVGFTEKEAVILEDILATSLPLAHLGYNPKVRYNRTYITSAYGQVQGRALQHSLPASAVLQNCEEEICDWSTYPKDIHFFVKGMGNAESAVLDHIGVHFKGFYLGSKPLTCFPLNRVPGGFRQSEAWEEYINGIIAAGLIKRESQMGNADGAGGVDGANGEFGNANALDVVTKGYVIPLAVVDQPSLTRAVLKDEILDMGRAATDPLVTMLSLIPANARVTNRLGSPEALEIMANVELTRKLAKNILTLLRNGMMWHWASWHAQNIYNEPDAEMVMADAADFIFMEDLTTDEYLDRLNQLQNDEKLNLFKFDADWVRVRVLAEALDHIRFLPTRDANGKPCESAVEFYKVLLDRELTAEELEFVVMDHYDKISSRKSKRVAKLMAADILARTYDQSRWTSTRDMRDCLAAKYNHKPDVDDPNKLMWGLVLYR